MAECLCEACMQTRMELGRSLRFYEALPHNPYAHLWEEEHPLLATGLVILLVILAIVAIWLVV